MRKKFKLKVVVAEAKKVLVCIWHILKFNVSYKDFEPQSLLLKIVHSLLSASCSNKFPLQGYEVSGSSTPFSEISQSFGYLWMPTYSFELEEKNTFLHMCHLSEFGEIGFLCGFGD